MFLKLTVGLPGVICYFMIYPGVAFPRIRSRIGPWQHTLTGVVTAHYYRIGVGLNKPTVWNTKKPRAAVTADRRILHSRSTSITRSKRGRCGKPRDGPLRIY